MAKQGESETTISPMGAMADMMGVDGGALLGRWSTGAFGWWDAANAAKPASSPMEMWISMFPASPYFGVKWMWQDMASGMQDFASGMQSMAAGMNALQTADAPGAAPLSPQAKSEKERLAATDLAHVLKSGASMSGPAEAQQLVEQGDEENAVVEVDVARTIAAVKAAPKPKPKAKPASPSAKEVAEAETRAAAEKAALDNVGVGALSDLSAVGGVAARFSADLGDAKRARKADLRVVGGSETDAEADAEADAAPTKPKNLLKKKPANPDDLKLIRGVGPRLEKLLNEAGVYRFDQIASFTDADFRWLDEALSTFKGRALRDKWREQAQELLKS